VWGNRVRVQPDIGLNFHRAQLLRVQPSSPLPVKLDPVIYGVLSEQERYEVQRRRARLETEATQMLVKAYGRGSWKTGKAWYNEQYLLARTHRFEVPVGLYRQADGSDYSISDDGQVRISASDSSRSHALHQVWPGSGDLPTGEGGGDG
jgi:hypothetical protein